MTDQKYDIVLANGRVIDPETYRDGKYNVGIIGDTIAAVSDQPLHGKEVIDVSGMIVSPGSSTCTPTPRTSPAIGFRAPMG